MFLIALMLLLAIGGSCGLELHIYNGTQDEIKNFPCLVSLQSQGQHFCGGAIYDTDLIVTAAHCLEFRKPEDVRIIAGRTNVVVRSDEEQISTARSFLFHPSFFYDETVVRNDIALIRTTSRFSWRNAVKPAVINPNWKSDVNESISVAGWGATKRRGQFSEHLFSAALNVQNDEKCKKAFPVSYEPESTFCLYSQGRDACNGDSGSPTTNRRNQVVGLVSYGGKECGRKPLVATRINYYLSWIEEQRQIINKGIGDVADPVNDVGNAGVSVLHASVFQRQTLESNHEEICGSTWKLNCFGKECYCYTLLNSRLAWYKAEERCGRYGGELTSIMSAEENVFVGKFVPSRFEKMWIGLNDLKSSGNLVWPDRNLSYTIWHHETQPDPKTHRCVEMDYHLKWKRSACANTLPSVCKVPVRGKDTSHKCQLGWALFDGYCYQIQASLLSWEEASRNCQRKGAHLASVRSPFENEFVIAVISDSGKDYVWIGLNDEEKEGIFVWSDQSRVGFTNFHEGEPNSFIGSENCVGVYMPSGLWNDYRCLLQFPSLCKKKAF